MLARHRKPQPPPTPTGSRFGLSPGAPIYNENPGTDLDAAKAAGAKRIRIDLNWAVIQAGGPSSYNWAPFDAAVNGSLARGLRPLLILLYTPAWARPAGTDARYEPDPATFATFAAAAARRYTTVHDWEIWNEPNISNTWAPKPDVAAYTAVLKAASAAIRNVDGTATVVTGGTSPAPSDGTQISPADFVAGIYSHGGQAYFDAVGQHPYCFPAYPGSSDTWSAWYQMVNKVRPLMVANGDSAKPIWATEFGSPSHDPAWPGLDETSEAQNVSQAYSLFKTYSWAGPLFWYSIRDTGTDPSFNGDWFGLERNGGSPKPAFGAYQQAAAAG